MDLWLGCKGAYNYWKRGNFGLLAGVWAVDSWFSYSTLAKTVASTKKKCSSQSVLLTKSVLPQNVLPSKRVLPIVFSLLDYILHEGYLLVSKSVLLIMFSLSIEFPLFSINSFFEKILLQRLNYWLRLVCFFLVGFEASKKKNNPTPGCFPGKPLYWLGVHFISYIWFGYHFPLECSTKNSVHPRVFSPKRVFSLVFCPKCSPQKKTVLLQVLFPKKMFSSKFSVLP